MKITDRLKKVIVLVLLFVVAFLLFVVVAKERNFFGPKTRTIMIYMSGNDLESSSGFATNDLESVLPSQIDLNHINILVYTGSTKKWQNTYISNEENAIFLLTSDGYKKIQSFSKKSLGNVESFEEFLNYSYQKYQAERYDLIFWNHGLGALGSISDEFSKDWLSSTEMSRALQHSEFKDKKFETVLFRTCLNSTLEVANELYPYAKYMIASEEITVGARGTSVLNFINDVNVSDDGISYGKKFIKSYQKQIDDIESEMMSSFSAKDIDSTYSIIDLSVIPKLIKRLDTFFANINININSDYNSIAQIRSNLHQYAKETSDCKEYDTVDLYELVEELNSISNYTGDGVLSLIRRAVKSNWSTNSHSNGISIYMPYYGSDNIIKLHLELYEHLNNTSASYKKFINNFYQIKTSPSSKQFSFFNNKIESLNKGLSMQLTDEQIDNYAYARYILFRKQYDDHDKIYKYYPLVSSYDVSLKSDSIVANVDNKLIKVMDKESGFVDYISAYELRDSKEKQYRIVPILFGAANDELSLDMACVNMNLVFDENNQPKIAKVQRCSSELNVSEDAIDISDWRVFQFLTTGYKILDENGNYIVDWPSNKYFVGYDLKIKDLYFETGDLVFDGKEEYYGIFQIFDVHDNSYYSNLIKIN